VYVEWIEMLGADHGLDDGFIGGIGRSDGVGLGHGMTVPAIPPVVNQLTLP
jgi:hypothetical protein